MLQRPWLRLSPRTWFRTRLDRDPRRWVLALAAAEGLVAFAGLLAGRRDVLQDGSDLLFALAMLVFMPAMGVLAMVVHGRLLLWTGSWLRGDAEPHQLHAAFAWAQAPLLVGAPLLLWFPLRVMAAELDPVPARATSALALVQAVAGPLRVVVALAALLALFLYVKFLAEAQGFSSWRALANQALALLLLASVVLVGVALGRGLHGRAGMAPVAFGVPVAILIALELTSRRFRASTRPGSA